MAQQAELNIAHREVVGKATKHLRKEGLIPANISGHNEASQAVQIDAVAFDRLRRSHGIRNILSLRLPDATQTVLIRNIQVDPVKGHVLHVDFARVSLRERIETKVPIHFVGEAPAVKLHSGVLLHLLDALTVECIAQDIIDSVDVDISSLEEIDAALHARDVKLPENFTLITDPNEPIAKVAATRAEVTGEAAAAEAAPETPATETAEGGEA